MLLRRSLAIDVLQILIAAIFLWHGVPKAIDPAAAIAKFEGFGLPGILGPVIGWAEVLAAPLLFLRPVRPAAAAALTVIIVGAIVTVQLPAGGISAGLERDLLILGGLIAILSSAPGSLAFGATTRGR